MASHIALLRAVNVGGHNRVPMARLRELILALGYEDVRTLLQSGNALFSTTDTADTAEQRLEAQIEGELGLSVRVLVRTRDELASVIETNLLGELATDPSRYAVTFLSRAPDPARLAALDPSAFLPDVFRAQGREIYAWYPDGQQKTKLTGALWEKRLGVIGTARNWNTVTKLLELAD
jgi:uncharacterized protein (DUF1697 family)